MRAAVVIGLVVAVPFASAVEGFFSTALDQVPLQILHAETPPFPSGVREIGIREGDARVVISVDEKGNLLETLVTGYSRREFAEVAEASLKRWRFAPAQVRGEPVASMREILFRFSNEGIAVVTQSASDSMTARVESMVPRERYRAHTLGELDQLPVQVRSPSPAYPPSLVGKGVGGRVTVEYYIDEEGRVRLPVIVSSPSEDLSLAVIGTLRQWHFEPPLRAGKPVLVLVRQTFNFEPAELAAGN